MSYSQDEYSEPGASRTSCWHSHALFAFIYLILLTDIVLLTLHQNGDFPRVLIVDRIASLFYDPFRGDFDLDILEGIWPGPAIIFALASLGLLHFGISRATPKEHDIPLMHRILSLFRLTFYVCMTVLAILIVIRTAIMTYHDITQPNQRGILQVGSPQR